MLVTIKIVLLLLMFTIAGLMSVFGRNLENICQALSLLDTTTNSQYGIRAQLRSDKVITTTLHYIAIFKVA